MLGYVIPRSSVERGSTYFNPSLFVWRYNVNARDKAGMLRLLGVMEQEREQGLAMDPDVYETACRVFSQVAIETVILRRRDDGTATGSIEVLLTRRPGNDWWYAALSHSPGSVNRYREPTHRTIDRVMRRELGGTAKLLHAQQVQAQNNWDEPRGHFWCIVYCCTIEGEPTHGTWCPISRLPKKLVDHHRIIIPVAATPFYAEPYPFGARWPKKIRPGVRRDRNPCEPHVRTKR